MQLETPGYLAGKVIALTMALSNCAQPVGQLVYGVLSMRCAVIWCRWHWVRRPYLWSLPD